MKISATTIFIMLFMVVSAHANYETTSSFNNLDALTSVQDGNGNSTTYSGRKDGQGRETGQTTDNILIPIFGARANVLLYF